MAQLFSLGVRATRFEFMNNQQDPFNDGRMMSGRFRIKNENFTFELWGKRPATPDEIEELFDFWMANEGRNMNLKNKIIQKAWNS